MFVEPVIQIRYVRTQAREPNLVVIFLKPRFGRAGDVERSIIAAGVEQRRYVSEFGTRRLSRFSRLLQPFEGALVIWESFLILLVCSETVRKHSPGFQ